VVTVKKTNAANFIIILPASNLRIIEDNYYVIDFKGFLATCCCNWLSDILGGFDELRLNQTL
jgi:hypothetical protein